MFLLKIRKLEYLFLYYIKAETFKHFVCYVLKYFTLKKKKSFLDVTNSVTRG